MKKIYGSIIIILLYAATTSVALAGVRISEVAWMGSVESANDEWIELFNDGSSAVSVEGWTLTAEDGSPIMSLQGSIPSGGYYVLERTDDGSEPSVVADLFYTGSLSNSGETLILKNTSGAVIDTAHGKDAWAIGGNNETKETLQRTSSGWTTAPKTPRAGGVVVAGTQDATSAPTTNPTTSSTNNSQSNVQAPTYGAPHMAVYAGEDRHVTAGADSVFKGEGIGIDKEPLSEHAVRWRWNFGDGVVTHGKRVTHTFSYPGTYVVELSVSNESMFESVSDRVVVTARPAQVTIVEATNQYIEIKNSDTVELDISRWLLTDGVRVFSIPEGSYILPGMSVRFSASVTNLQGGGNTALLYPNTMRATTVSAQGEGVVSKDTQVVYDIAPRPISAPTTAPVRITKPIPIQTPSTLPMIDGKEKDTPPAQSADAILAVDPLAAAAVASASTENTLYKWLLMLSALIAIAGVILFIHDGHKDTDTHAVTNEADKYTIVS